MLRSRGVRTVVGLDLTAAMLRRARRTATSLAQADMRWLPLASARFDLVVCGLAVGHVPVLEDVLREVARVLKPGGVAVYSDMHPDGARRGWRRTFNTPDGCLHTLLHHVHPRPAHASACAQAGLRIDEIREPVVDFDHPHRGQPAVVVVRATRAPAPGALA
jgi:malonyl-CoA O-methyltransferase